MSIVAAIFAIKNNQEIQQLFNRNSNNRQKVQGNGNIQLIAEENRIAR
jgi:hypothetical protein